MRPGDAQAERERQEHADREAIRARLRQFLNEIQQHGKTPRNTPGTASEQPYNSTPTADGARVPPKRPEGFNQDSGIDLLRPIEETLRLMREQDARGWIIDVSTGQRWPK